VCTCPGQPFNLLLLLEQNQVVGAGDRDDTAQEYVCTHTHVGHPVVVLGFSTECCSLHCMQTVLIPRNFQLLLDLK